MPWYDAQGADEVRAQLAAPPVPVGDYMFLPLDHVTYGQIDHGPHCGFWSDPIVKGVPFGHLDTDLSFADPQARYIGPGPTQSISPRQAFVFDLNCVVQMTVELWATPAVNVSFLGVGVVGTAADDPDSWWFQAEDDYGVNSIPAHLFSPNLLTWPAVKVKAGQMIALQFEAKIGSAWTENVADSGSSMSFTRVG